MKETQIEPYKFLLYVLRINLKQNVKLKIVNGRSSEMSKATTDKIHDHTGKLNVF